MIGVALLGSGIFAKDAWLPLLKQHEDESIHPFELKAIWSRSAESVATLAQCDATHGSRVRSLHGDQGLAEILHSSDVDAVIIVLPVHVSLQVVTQALQAGKCVLSEKPIAPTVAQAAAALQSYQMMKTTPVWCVGENYRFEEVFDAAAKLVPSLGDIIKLDLVADMPMNPSNKYFGSGWRRDNTCCPGGFLMDMSVHYVAALRKLAAAAGATRAVSCMARTIERESHVPAPHGAVGVVSWDNDLHAAISLSMSGHHVNFTLSVTGSKGTVECSRGGWSGSRTGYRLTYIREGSAAPVHRDFAFTGLPREFQQFLGRVRAYKEEGSLSLAEGNAIWPGSAAEATHDLAVIEAIVQSGQRGGQLVHVSST